MKLWIVGKYVYHKRGRKESAWEFQGVFSSLRRAKSACKTRDYFYAPAKLNERIPHTQEAWIGLHYPIAEAEILKASIDSLQKAFNPLAKIAKGFRVDAAMIRPLPAIKGKIISFKSKVDKATGIPINITKYDTGEELVDIPHGTATGKHSALARLIK